MIPVSVHFAEGCELMQFAELPRRGDVVRLEMRSRALGKPVGRFVVDHIEHLPCVDMQCPGIEVHLMPYMT